MACAIDSCVHQSAPLHVLPGCLAVVRELYWRGSLECVLAGPCDVVGYGSGADERAAEVGVTLRSFFQWGARLMEERDDSIRLVEGNEGAKEEEQRGLPRTGAHECFDTPDWRS